MATEKLEEILRKHALWLDEQPGGERADLSGWNLRGADLRGFDLRYAIMEGADMDGAILDNSDMRWTVLKLASMRGCSMNNTIFNQADCRGVDMTGADCQKSQMRGTVLTNSKQVNANFTGSDLRGAVFAGSNSKGAIFNGSDLRGADMTGTKVRRANIEDANLSGAKLARDFRTILNGWMNRLRQVLGQTPPQLTAVPKSTPAAEKEVTAPAPSEPQKTAAKEGLDKQQKQELTEKPTQATELAEAMDDADSKGQVQEQPVQQEAAEEPQDVEEDFEFEM